MTIKLSGSHTTTLNLLRYTFLLFINKTRLFVKIQARKSRKRKCEVYLPPPLLLEWQNKFGRIEFEQNQWRDAQYHLLQNIMIFDPIYS